MAMQTASPSPPPTAQYIGNAFVEQYYHILHHSPELVYRFYQDSSVLSRPDPNGLMKTVKTMKSINDIICSLDYKNYKAEIRTADAQGSYQDGVILLVTGCLTGTDNLKKKFTQTFFLAPQDKGFYVLNDVFRYIEESEPDISVEVVTGVDGTSSSSAATHDPEPAQVVVSPNLDQIISQVDEVEKSEEKTVDQVIEERQADNHMDILVESESHHENHESVVEDSVTSPSEEDAPKKSYASIVTLQKKKGPIKVYVPTNAAKPAQAKTDKQALKPAAEGSRPESSTHVAPESKDIQGEVEGHSIYVRNLPLNLPVADLEIEFQKFGPIKPNGVQVRINWEQRFCFGFVEFQEFSSMQNAIKASPITIGDRRATVEIKRTTTRVGSSRGPFSSSRGGFRNEISRGRGNFSGGRTYGRNDSFRGRGNFSNGPGGEGGYQQGRGRGNQQSSPNQKPVSS
ncbi:hypothetical protein CASFOL_032884 [Castilleja foliolosa]|uniref:Uncharacterized protein n=1 Tax=Castilleja foliolosa TaxID=1961234 RepID=A0ABD3C2R8_9LAMI